MPTGSEELQNHDEKTWADMMIYDQVFPHTRNIFSVLPSLGLIPICLYISYSICFPYSQQAGPYSTWFPPACIVVVLHCSYMDLLSLFTPSFLGGPTESDKISLFIFTFWHACLCFFVVFTSRLLIAAVNSVVLSTMLYCGVRPYTINCSQYKN